jgi:hypothetical protein
MAAREFHGILRNLCDSNLASHDQDCDSGEWQEPWYPYQRPGAGFIQSDEYGEWRSESDGVATGTSGWVKWVIDVKTFNEPDHTELVQVNWSIPFKGAPNVTCATARFDDSGGFAVQGPPVLEIKPVSYGEVGQAPALAQAATIAPYVFALPWSFAVRDLVTEHLQVTFELHRVALGQSSPLQFSTGGPSEQVRDAEAFRNRARAAASTRFVGGFPNFYEALRGRDHVGGTVFVNAETAQWRDVELAELNNVSLDDFAGRLRATQDYAALNGFVGGFPTYYHALQQRIRQEGRPTHVTVCGTVLLTADGAEFRDVPLADLGNPDLADVGARFRASQDYASRNGFVGGFPTMNHATEQRVQIEGPPKTVTVCGTVLIKSGFGEWRDAVLFQDPA